MLTKILVLYYSSYGHIEVLADAVATGARSLDGTSVVVKRVPELVTQAIALKANMKLQQSAPIASVEELPDYDALI